MTGYSAFLQRFLTLSFVFIALLFQSQSGFCQIQNRSGEDSTIFISHSVFVPRHAYNSGKKNWGVDVGDFNKDGKMDIVSCSEQDNAINVHFNDGKGDFTNVKSFPGGKSNRDVFVLDANADGKPDIAFVSIADMQVGWLINKGNGDFYPKKAVMTGGFPHDVKGGDVNQDGKIDLVTVTNGDGNVNIHLGDGAGNFAGAIKIKTSSKPRSVAIGDANEDGIPDLVVGCDYGIIALHFGTGGGKFSPYTKITSATSVWGLGMADFNGDGLLDIAAADYDVNMLCIHYGGGGNTFKTEKGKFAEKQCVSSGDKNFDLVLGDFDMDGDIDIVTASTRDEVINLHLNDGTGTFSEKFKIKSGNWNAAIAAADFDGDKDLDIVTGSLNDNMINVHRNVTIEPEKEATSACVYGTIFDKDKGKGIESIVSIVGEDGYSVKSMKTGPDGKYRLCGIGFKRNYILRVKAMGFPKYEEKFDLPKTTAKEGLKIDVYLERIKETHVYGIVKDAETGTVLPGATITIKDKNGKLVTTLTTDGRGAYKQTLPFDSNYELTASLEKYNEKSAVVSLYPNDYPNGVRKDFELLKIKPKTTACVEGDVLDEKTKEKLPGADLRIMDKDGNIVKRVTADEKGHYKACVPFGAYDIAANKKGYMFKVDQFEIGMEHAETGLTKDIELMKFEVGMSIVLKNIYYDVAKATLRPESVAELERLVQIMNENPTLVVEIAGHTDSDGSDSYNLNLSQARAQSVVDYMLDAAIPENRLVAKGYGETTPIAPNDTKENKQLNRRTEFKVLAF